MFYQNAGENGVLNVIGPNIKKIRIQRGMSQSDLSTRAQEKGTIKLSTATICKIEHQQRSVYDYEAKIIAQILNVKIDDLYN